MGECTEKKVNTTPHIHMQHYTNCTTNDTIDSTIIQKATQNLISGSNQSRHSPPVNFKNDQQKGHHHTWANVRWTRQIKLIKDKRR